MPYSCSHLGKSLYFDTLQVVPIGKTGDLGLPEKETENLASEPSPVSQAVMIIIAVTVTIASAALIIAVVVIIMATRRKKKITQS